ncbi:hypothetical protein PG996_015225 [Apiospora saccharicola]|uniref:Uncharacterized protein n=1 Tax=Apiospora saccharicola TaxID=335842 RepID=A0ABR1TKI4_9PEZI
MAAPKSQFSCSIKNDAIKISRSVAATQGDSSLKIQFMRTLRVPANAPADSTLPPGLGQFPLDKVHDYPGMFPRGNQPRRRRTEESMWISFKSQDPYMIKVYAGDVNVVSGEHKYEGSETEARLRLRYHSQKRVQDYVAAPKQLSVA